MSSDNCQANTMVQPGSRCRMGWHASTIFLLCCLWARTCSATSVPVVAARQSMTSIEYNSPGDRGDDIDPRYHQQVRSLREGDFNNQFRLRCSRICEQHDDPEGQRSVQCRRMCTSALADDDEREADEHGSDRQMTKCLRVCDGWEACIQGCRSAATIVKNLHDSGRVPSKAKFKHRQPLRFSSNTQLIPIVQLEQQVDDEADDGGAEQDHSDADIRESGYRHNVKNTKNHKMFIAEIPDNPERHGSADLHQVPLKGSVGDYLSTWLQNKIRLKQLLGMTSDSSDKNGQDNEEVDDDDDEDDDDRRPHSSQSEALTQKQSGKSGKQRGQSVAGPEATRRYRRSRRSIILVTTAFVVLGLLLAVAIVVSTLYVKRYRECANAYAKLDEKMDGASISGDLEADR